MNIRVIRGRLLTSSKCLPVPSSDRASGRRNRWPQALLVPLFDCPAKVRRPFARKPGAPRRPAWGKSRARQYRSQRLGKLRIRHWIGRDAVHRAAQRFVREYVADCPDLIVQVNPAHPLTATADLSAQSHSKRRQHLFQCATFSAQNDAGSQESRANASLHRRIRGRFPFATNLRQESASAGSAVFAQYLIIAITVKSDCRGRDQDTRRRRRPSKRFGKMTRPENPAVPNCLFLRLRPAAGNGFSRKMNHCVEA